MSLNINIDINSRTIGTLNIQRLYSAQNGEHSYLVKSKVDGVERKAGFKHQENDGPLICIQEAIKALEKNKNLTPNLIDKNFPKESTDL